VPKSGPFKNEGIHEVAKPFFLEAVGLIKFEERTFELVEGMPELAEIVASLLEARWKLLNPSYGFDFR
jgi:hypothetical protein